NLEDFPKTGNREVPVAIRIDVRVRTRERKCLHRAGFHTELSASRDAPRTIDVTRAASEWICRHSHHAARIEPGDRADSRVEIGCRNAYAIPQQVLIHAAV